MLSGRTQRRTCRRQQSEEMEIQNKYKIYNKKYYLKLSAYGICIRQFVPTLTMTNWHFSHLLLIDRTVVLILLFFLLYTNAFPRTSTYVTSNVREQLIGGPSAIATDIVPARHSDISAIENFL